MRCPRRVNDCPGIDLAVIVDHTIAQSRHLAKWNCFEQRNGFGHQSCRTLADHHQSAQHRVLSLQILQQIFLANTVHVAFDGCRRLQNIQQLRGLSILPQCTYEDLARGFKNGPLPDRVLTPFDRAPRHQVHLAAEQYFQLILHRKEFEPRVYFRTERDHQVHIAALGRFPPRQRAKNLYSGNSVLSAERGQALCHCS